MDNGLQKYKTGLVSEDKYILLDEFLRTLSPNTRRAYAKDIDCFASFCEMKTQEAINALLSNGPGEANRTVLMYRVDMEKRGLSSATINRRLASVRAVVRLARSFGKIVWALEVPGLKREKRRDSKGPGRLGFLHILEAASNQPSPKKERDVALLRLGYGLALRRSEICNLLFEDLEGESIRVTSKGRREKMLLQIPANALKSLQEWLVIRGNDPGPLFASFQRAKKGRKITPNGLYHIVTSLADKVGIKTRPHGLMRHAPISEAFRITNLFKASKFARHSCVQVTENYIDDDNEATMASVATAVDGAI